MINNMEIKGYDFICTLESGKVVEGEYTIAWDDDIPYCDSITVEGKISNRLSDMIYDYITDNGDSVDWYADRQGALIDNAYDNYKDR